MSQVAVQKIDTSKPISKDKMDETSGFADRIRQRAYELFQGRGSFTDSAMDDWFAAERDLFRIPESELIERDGKFEARLCAPGFQPDDVKVTATPDALIVNGSTSHRHDETEQGVRFCEFDQRALFRRFDLPESIDLDRVSANLDNGMLCVTAAKSKQDSGSQREERSSQPGSKKQPAR